MSDKAILFDSSRCSACKGCQVACKCWNNLPSPLGHNVQEFTGSYQSPVDLNGDTRLIVTFHEENGGPTSVQWSFGRRGCQHCINPACASVCPSGAIGVDEATGMVTVNEDDCVGCQYCSAACPFDVPRYHGPKSKINKCTGCVDRIEQGRDPACVQTCQPEAMKFGDRDEMLAIAHERVEMLHNKGFTEARVYGEDELDGLRVIMVTKYGLDTYGMPEDPQISPIVDVLSILKPVTGLGVAAVVAGLGLSFLTGVGYKRHKMRYDEKNRDVIDIETGEVLKHIEEDGTVTEVAHADDHGKKKGEK